MESWPSFSTDSSANRQSRYPGSALQNPSTSPQHSREYTTQQLPPPPHAQPAYQTYHSQAGSTVAVGLSSTRPENTSEYAPDIQMQDADSYASPRGKFQQTPQQQQARQPYLGSDESATTQRYSPMPQQGQYASSNQSHAPQAPSLSQMSSYQQHRQSPSSRPNYTNPSQPYYSHNPSSGSPRTGALPPVQSYQRPLQQSSPLPTSGPLSNNPPLSLDPINLSHNTGSDPNSGSRYYPQSASLPQAPIFDQPSPAQPSPQRDLQPRLQRVNTISDLQPRVNSQPAHRRANPEGGFISPVQALTTYLPATYRICNPQFKYESSRNPRRVLTKPSKGVKNDGYDNEDSDYILYVNDILGSEETKNRYLILDVLGQGTFGQVVKCQNLKTQEVVAVKVVKNRTAYFNQSMMEVSVLDLLNSKLDKNDDHHILRLKDTFIHKQHLCLVFELLSVNLYELIKQNQFRGLSTTLVRVFAQQLLNALCLLNKARLIHCDLKPENILLKNLESPIIKVIDFGSACDERQTVYTYIQSRFYRSPEVLLGLPYSSSIDMWSLGCIVVELFLGLPLFPGSSEYNQVARITEMLGMPPVWMIEMGKQAGDFFEKVTDEFGRKTYRLKSMELYSKEHGTKEQPSKKYFQATTLPEIIRQYAMPRKNMKPIEIEREMNNRVAFIDFVRGLLCINPMERWSPQQAKMHPFITQQKYTGPFVPPMNLKNNSPLQKSPMSAVEQSQRAEQAARQKQQQQQQQQQQQAAQAQVAQAQVAQAQVAQAQAAQAQAAQAQAAQAQAAQAQVQAAQAAQAQAQKLYHSQSQTQPPVYNNMYHPPQHTQQQPAPPTYSTGGTQYSGISQPQHPQQSSQMSGQYQSGMYNQNNPRSRQRSATMMDGTGIPPQIQRAASMMDPNHPIRLQPSPAYFPPPPGGVPDETASNRQRGRGGQYRRDVVRNLEDRTLEDGLFNQQRWA